MPSVTECSTHGYFPYLPLLREQRLRPIDPFGHRIAGDFTQLIGRGPDHIVVAVFGGSAAQGVNVIFEETFGHKLENVLNRRLGNGGGARFTVLNFSISGHLVTDELLTYIIHGDRLRPEVVISFDGWNDLANGAVNDPYLVN